MSKKEKITVVQKGGCSTGCMIGLGIIAAFVFVLFVLPTGCTIFGAKVILDEAIKMESEKRAEEVTPVATEPATTPE